MPLPENLSIGKVFNRYGNDFESDMKKASENPKNIEWRNLIAPLLERVKEATPSEHWHIIPEVFHVD